jgi:hypothetical protein
LYAALGLRVWAVVLCAAAAVIELAAVAAGDSHVTSSTDQLDLLGRLKTWRCDKF